MISIKNSTFYGCTSLTSITIPNNITSIESSAFRYCTSLTDIKIGDGVTSIGSAAFRNCNSLENITIPNSATSIGSSAFADCSSLKEIYCKPTTPPTVTSNTIFNNNASIRKIYVPTESTNVYTSTNYWKDYASDIVGYPF